MKRIFQSTLPLRGATVPDRHHHHRRNFNPRSPCGERPATGKKIPTIESFQSTLPLRGATQVTGRKLSDIIISIHAPLAGSDHVPAVRKVAGRAISIHAPLAGSDRRPHMVLTSVRDFNPRSPCGERPACGMSSSARRVFQSTLPLRGATAPVVGHLVVDDISIHAPLAGSDMLIPGHTSSRSDFNPRSPCGERLHKWTSKVHRMRQYLIHALESISSSPHIHFKMTCNQVLYF